MNNAPADAFASALGALLFPASVTPAATASSVAKSAVSESALSESALTESSFTEPPPRPSALVVALSGGCDSIVLLQLAWAYARRHELPLRAIHVNHQLQVAAADFARHCEQRCHALHVPLQMLTVEVVRTDKGLEADARAARYDAFAQSLQAGEVLLLGHHADDQLETLMLQLLRGAGPHGLAGMPVQARCGAGCLYRPLLTVRRAAIRALAAQQQWPWIEDPSNADHRLARNRLRAELMPVLLAQREGAAEVLLRAVQWQAESAALLTDLAALDARAVQYPNGNLSRQRLLALAPTRQANLLRGWLQQQQLPAPNADKLHSFLSQLPTASERIQLRWGEHELRMAADQIVALPALPMPPTAELAWQAGDAFKQPDSLVLPIGLGVLRWQLLSSQPPLPITGQTESAPALPALMLRAPRADERVTVRWHTPGLKVALHRRAGRRELKDIFQEQRVPAWLRPYWPKLFYNDELVALPGLLITAAGWPPDSQSQESQSQESQSEEGQSKDCQSAHSMAGQLQLQGPLFTLAARLQTPDAALR